jgi:hypothetical protein
MSAAISLEIARSDSRRATDVGPSCGSVERERAITASTTYVNQPDGQSEMHCALSKALPASYWNKIVFDFESFEQHK